MLGEGWDSIEEQSVTLAASLADKGLRARKSVGLISNGAELTWLAPKKGGGQRWEIMQALALARPGELDLGTVLERIQPSLGKHHSLLIITASTKTSWLKTLLPLSNRNIIPTVFLLDASTFGGEVSAENVSASLEAARHYLSYHSTRLDRDCQKHPRSDKSTGRGMSTPTGEIVPIKN